MSSAGNSKIDCTAAREHLSAFHDDELPKELRAAVSEHLAGCEACAQKLAEFGQLSDLATAQPNPVIPAGIWSQIEKRIGVPETVSRSSDAGTKRRWAMLATAALLLVALGVAFWLGTSEHNHLVMNFDRFLGDFERNPPAAQQALLVSYEGRPVTYEEAALQLQYQPTIPQELPNGMVRKAIYLLRMPCCLCVETVYGRPSGEQVAVFEHVDEQSVWFGKRSMIHTSCNGVPTSLVQCDGYLVANWQQNGRVLTVVGLQDIEQVTELVAVLGGEATPN